MLKITIITPTKNSEKYIINNLWSVHRSQGPSLDLEQIIVDSESTDKTIKLIEDFKNKYNSKIKIIVKKDNSMYEAINTALNQEIGDVWACLNADDIYYPFTLRKILKVFLENPSIDVVCAPLAWCKHGKIKQIVYCPTFNLEYMIRTQSCIMYQPSTFLRRDVVKKIGLFNTQYKYASDYDYQVRLGQSCILKRLDYPTTIYMDHDSSLSRLQSNVQALETQTIAYHYKHVLALPSSSMMIYDELTRLQQFKGKYFLALPRRIKKNIVNKIIKKQDLK